MQALAALSLVVGSHHAVRSRDDVPTCEACAGSVGEADARHALLYVEIAHVVVDGFRVVLDGCHLAEVLDQNLAQTGVFAVLAPVGGRTVVECLLVQDDLVLQNAA